jgi:hypothetical protein
MFTTYIVVTTLAAAANIFSATLDFIRYQSILINMAKVGVSESWITTLGILKAAGALGLLIGIGVPAVGSPPPPASSCFLSALSSLTCAGTTTRSASRSCSFSWQSPRWGCDWFRAEESDLIQLSIEFRRSNGSNFGPAQFIILLSQPVG